MNSLTEKWSNLSPYIKGLLRIVTAFMYLTHGTMKLFAFPASIFPNGGTVNLISEFGLAGILETLGGFLLLIGLYTRPVAFILAGEMAVAYFQVQFPHNYWPILNHGEITVLYSFLWLYFSASGAGKLSVDGLRKK